MHDPVTGISPNKRRRAIKNEACVCTKAPREGAPPNDRGCRRRRRRRRLCGGGSEVFALAGNLSLLSLSCSSKNRQGFTVQDETRKPIYTTHTHTRTHRHTYTRNMPAVTLRPRCSLPHLRGTRPRRQEVCLLNVHCIAHKRSPRVFYTFHNSIYNIYNIYI